MPRPHHATVVAYLALFVALGGSSLAISTASKQRAEQPSLRDTSTKTAKLLTAGGPSASTAAKGKRGKRGPRGPRGAAAATNAVTRFVEVGPTTSDGSTGAIAGCAPGETATGGGFISGNTEGIINSVPVLTGTRPTGWAVQYRNYLPGRAAYVVCISP